MKEFLGIFLPLMGGVIAWYANERKKRQWEEYSRKEENYKVLIRSLKGFYVGSQEPSVKALFLEQLNICWLYCPDEVINKAYNFLSKVQTGQVSTSEEKEIALGEFMISIRKDLLSRNITTSTNLLPKHFKIFGST